MAKKKYDFSSLEGLTKIFNDAVEDMAHEVLWQIENIYESAIEKFYADYSPLYYNRTGSTFLGSSGYDILFSPQNISGGNGNWTAGITVDSSYIPGKPYRADTDWVFERTFVKGIHGIKAGKAWGKDYKKTFTRYSGDFYKTYQVKLIPGTRYALKQTSVTKHFTDGVKIQRREMSNMSPSPKGIVAKEFRQLTRKKNMKRMFNNILTSKFR